jgi:hypothetical protein
MNFFDFHLQIRQFLNLAHISNHLVEWIRFEKKVRESIHDKLKLFEIIFFRRIFFPKLRRRNCFLTKRSPNKPGIYFDKKTKTSI